MTNPALIDAAIRRHKTSDGYGYELVLQLHGDTIEVPCISEQAAQELAATFTRTTAVVVRYMY